MTETDGRGRASLMESVCLTFHISLHVTRASVTWALKPETVLSDWCSLSHLNLSAALWVVDPILEMWKACPQRWGNVPKAKASSAGLGAWALTSKGWSNPPCAPPCAVVWQLQEQCASQLGPWVRRPGVMLGRHHSTPDWKPCSDFLILRTPGRNPVITACLWHFSFSKASFKCWNNGENQVLSYSCLLTLERNLFFLGQKGDSVTEASMYRSVSRMHSVPKIKYTETNINQKHPSDVSCRLRRIGFMMKCSWNMWIPLSFFSWHLPQLPFSTRRLDFLLFLSRELFTEEDIKAAFSASNSVAHIMMASPFPGRFSWVPGLPLWINLLGARPPWKALSVILSRWLWVGFLRQENPFCPL